MTTRWRPGHVLPLALAAALAGAATARAEDLAGSEWRPLRIGAAEVPADAKGFIQFKAGGEIAGNGGCNRFFGRYHSDGEAIEISALGTTRMACPAPVMALEASFLAALEGARTWQRERTSLVLFDGARQPLARLQQTDAD